MNDETELQQSPIRAGKLCEDLATLNGSDLRLEGFVISHETLVISSRNEIVPEKVTEIRFHFTQFCDIAVEMHNARFRPATDDEDSRLIVSLPKAIQRFFQAQNDSLYGTSLRCGHLIIEANEGVFSLWAAKVDCIPVPPGEYEFGGGYLYDKPLEVGWPSLSQI